MLNRIIAFSIRQKLIIGLFTVGLIVVGVYEATRLPIDAVPDITNNQVQVITVAPSFGAADIERLVTFPVEIANSNISGIEEIRSFSRFGLSLVTIVFNDDVDVYWARQQVAERLQQVQSEIPEGIGTPTLGPITTGLGEIYQYVVKAAPGYETTYDATELRTIQDWIIRRQLLGVKGVAEVSSFGGKLKQFEVAVDPGTLQSFGLSLSDVFNALHTNNQNVGGAYIEKGPTVLFIRSEGLIGSPEDIENITVKSTDEGLPVRIRDIGKVQLGTATRFGALCYNDEGEVAGAIVMMLNGANSSEVIRLVKERMELIRKNLPEGVLVEAFLDRTKMVNNAISTVQTNLAEGALIVVFILVLFLGNLRAGLLVASVIPLSLLFAIVMMNLFGVSGNLMSLGALDFGLIVDGAVIVVEAVMHQLTHNRQYAAVNRISQQEMDKQVSKAASRMMNSAVFGQIIILIVYLPIFSLSGIEGKMFRPMAQTVAFALLGAFLLSLTYIPMMSSLFISRNIHHKPNLSERIMQRLENIYDRLLIKALQWKKLVLASALLLFVAALFILSRMGGEFIPELEEGDFAVDTRVLTGSNLNTTIAYTKKAAGLLLKRFPEVEKVVTKIGSGEVPTDPMPMEASDMMVILKDKKQWTSAKSFPELSEKMSEALKEIPGITTGFQYPVQMRFNELMTGARQDVVVKIFGENLDSLALYASRVGAIVQSVDGAEDLYVETVTGVSQVVVEYNRPMLQQYGVDINYINQLINMAFAGAAAGTVFEGERRFDLVLRLPELQRQSVDDIRNLMVPLASGAQIPLHQLASVSQQDGPYQIQREDAKRRITVGFNVSNRDVESIVNELREKVSTSVDMPPGYYVNYGGTFENLNAARSRLMVAVPVALLLIFILLFFAFRSIRYGILIFSAIPLSAIGGILFLALRNMPFSISAGIGFIALFGVSVLNGIVLVAEFKRLRDGGHVSDLREIVRKGGRLRLRPVLMTASVASLGFLPMALSQGAGAEVQRPLATVVIGGLLVATMLTLFVLPILYTLFEQTTAMKKNKLSPKGYLLLVLAIFSAKNIGAQNISLPAAIDSALQNHLALKHSRAIETRQDAMRKAHDGIPFTSISADIGQFNSIYTDTRFGLSQGFRMPGYYNKQRIWLEEEWKTATSATVALEAEIVRDVQQVYYEMDYLQQKLLLTDSSIFLHEEMLTRSKQRVSAGETDLLEQSNWQLALSRLQSQHQRIQNELHSAAIQFRQLLQVRSIYLPQTMSPAVVGTAFDTSTVAENHPALAFYQQQVNTAEKLVDAEQSKLSPVIEIGYANQSIRGIGADDKFYNGGKRFHAGQIGVGIPLFNGAQKARTKAAKAQVAVAEANLQWQQTAWDTQLSLAYAAYDNMMKLVTQMKEQQLPTALQMQHIANDQLKAGAISYLEWAQLYDRSFQTRMEYLLLQHELNKAITTINYLLLH